MTVEALQRSILAERCRQEAIRVRKQAEEIQAENHYLLSPRERMQLLAAETAIRAEMSGAQSFDQAYQQRLHSLACQTGPASD